MRLHRALATTTLTLTCALAAALPAAAQQKVTVGGRPAPGQTVHLKIVQDLDMNMTGGPMGALHMVAKNTTIVLQKVGTPDANGVIKIDMTYEDVTMDMKLNDQPPPPEATEVAQRLKGKTLSMTVDANGEVVEATPPADFPLPPAQVKDMLKQALGLMPKQEMTVGQSVTSPFAMALPIPMPTGEPPQMKGELKSTLTGVTGAAESQVAALDQAVTAAVDSTVPGPGGGDLGIKMAVKGSGTTNWHVTGALVQGSKMTTQISGTLTVPGAGAIDLSGTTVVNLERIP